MPFAKGQSAWNKGVHGHPHKPYAPKYNRWQNKAHLCLSCNKGAQTKPRDSCQFQQHTNSYRLVIQRNKDASLKRKYGLSRKEVEERKLSQENKCAICLQISRRLCVDHNHLSGKLRGMLCDDCNLRVAQFEHPLAQLTRKYLILYEGTDPWS